MIQDPFRPGPPSRFDRGLSRCHRVPVASTSTPVPRPSEVDLDPYGILSDIADIGDELDRLSR